MAEQLETRLRVLVVEDEGIVAAEIQERLTRLGCTVTGVVASGAEAIQVAEHVSPDLVLMDIHLQGSMDGIEAADYIGGCLDIPVVYLTAHSDALTLARAKASAPFGYVLKPFRERDLLIAIEVALQRHALEQQLKESEQKYAATLTSIGDGVIATDQEGRVVFMNRVAEALTGWTFGEAQGLPVDTVLPLVHESSGAVIEPPLYQALRHGAVVTLSAPVLLCTRDHRTIPIEDSAAHITSAKGVVTGAVMAFRDVTMRRHLEAQLREAQKMEAIGTLAGGIAYDFNNILQIIIGSTELAQGQVTPASPLWQLLQYVLTAGQRAKELVQQMLTFSRDQAPQRQPLRLHQLLQETLPLLRAALPSTIDIRTFLNTTSGTVLAHPSQLRQVLLNLASNAAYAMRTTGGVLEVHLDEMDLTSDRADAPPTLPPGLFLRLTVRDTGVGMTPEVMARIFEPFFTTKSAGEGTGLGLAVVYGIIGRHEGSITCASTPGQGTTFTIYLPRVVEAPRGVEAPPVEHSLADPLPTGPEHLLFVDDEETLGILAQEMLGDLGYDVTVCTSGLVALAAFRATPLDFDLIITDQTMPAMTGETLVRELRRIRPDIPIILCTGYSPLIDAERAAALGIDAFLLKPIEPQTLAHTIRQVLAQRHGGNDPE